MSELARRSSWWHLLLLCVAFAAFANTFGHGWTYDDFPVVVNNPDIRSLGNFFQNQYPGRPLRELSYLLDYSLFCLSHDAFQVQNILWHALNGVLVCRLALRLGATLGASVAAGGLFLVHPLTVEVVANISHRKDSMALAFMLMGILAYDRFRHKGGAKQWRWLVVALVCSLLAYAAKENALVLPLVFLAYEAIFVPPAKQLLINRIRTPGASLGTAAALVFFVGWLLSQGGILYAELAASRLAKLNYFGPWDIALHLRAVVRGWGYMLERLVFPVDLSPEYTFDIPPHWLEADVLLVLLSMGGLLATAIATRKKPVVLFSFVVFFLLLLPVSNLWPLPTYFAADRYMYAPLALLAVLCAHLFTVLSRRFLWIYSALIVLSIILSVLTWQQNRVWASPATLWHNVLEVNPRSAVALNNLGKIAYECGEYAQALDFFGKAVRVNPNIPEVHYNLGGLVEQVGNRGQAVRHFRRYLQFENPGSTVRVKQVREHLDQFYPGWQLGMTLPD